MPFKAALDALTSLATAVGANAAPAVGVLVAGWQPQTAMLLYAFETMLAVTLVSLRRCSPCCRGGSQFIVAASSAPRPLSLQSP
jgi:hypothetical protein